MSQVMRWLLFHDIWLDSEVICKFISVAGDVQIHVKFIMFIWKYNSVDSLGSEFHVAALYKNLKILSQLVEPNVNISSFLKPIFLVSANYYFSFLSSLLCNASFCKLFALLYFSVKVYHSCSSVRNVHKAS